jgi:anti-sigma factor RsiW
MLALAIPGIGPAIAAGPLAAAIVGASVGAAAGGLIGALTSIGVPEEDARRYSEGIRRGGMLVAVHTNDALADLASGVLERNGAQDIDERSAVGSDAPLAQDHGLDPGEFQDKRSSRAVRSYTRVS